MIANKTITKIVAVLMAAAVVLCLCATIFSTQIVSIAGGLGVTMEYENKLFDTNNVLEINILIDDADWQSLLDNAINEEYVQCDVEIGGDTFYRVGIRPKGNTSLSSIFNDPDTDRYSLKLEFDQYIDGQTCYGLDKLILNNSYADATYMKESLIYDMFHELGTDAALYNYAKLSVNDEYWGLYLALEAVEDSFLLRNYGTTNGELYKPDSMNMGGGDRGGMKGGSGSNLNYSNDNLDSYSAIWEGEVTSTSDGDHKRVVTALRNISEGTELERYMDIDNLMNYMAVHIFSENADSLSGNMAHNYYLYESNGQLNLLPWDYNLVFGGMGHMDRGGGSGATDTINGAIDDAWNSTDFFDTLLADEDYHAAYYDAMKQVVNYVQNGGFEKFYTHTRSIIDTLVETDPNAFYTYEEYLTAVETLYEVVSLRAQSIQGQLDGSIPTTDSEQQNSDTLIDASHIDLSVMGSMNMGGAGDRGEKRSQPIQQTASLSSNLSDDSSRELPENFANFGDGELPEGLEGMEPPEGFDPSQFGEKMPDGFGQPGEMQENDKTQPEMGNRPDRNFSNQSGAMSNTLINYGVSAIVMLAASLFVIFYRRKPRKR